MHHHGWRHAPAGCHASMGSALLPLLRTEAGGGAAEAASWARGHKLAGMTPPCCCTRSAWPPIARTHKRAVELRYRAHYWPGGGLSISLKMEDQIKFVAFGGRDGLSHAMGCARPLVPPGAAASDPAHTIAHSQRKRGFTYIAFYLKHLDPKRAPGYCLDTPHPSLS